MAEKDLAAFGVVTETGSFLSTDFPLDRSLEHRVRTGQMKVAERDSDGEFRPCDTVLVVRDRGSLVPFDREAHDAQQKHSGSTVPQEWYDTEYGGVEDQGTAQSETEAPRKRSRNGRKTNGGEELEDQGE